MDDIEKTRVEYVARLEEQVQHLQRQLAEFKPLAEKWTPVITGQMEQGGDVRFTLSFGGKLLTATVGASAFNSNTVSDLTTGITNTLCESLLVDRLRVIVQPEVERLLKGAQGASGAGKW